jgi:hypothetical protein
VLKVGGGEPHERLLLRLQPGRHVHEQRH